MREFATCVRQHGPRRLAVLIFAIGATLAVPPPVTAALDGSTPMLCSIAAVLECDASKCERATTDDADLPNFVRVDVPKKLVTAVPGGKQTTIKFSERLDGRLVLHGGENGRGWTATIAENSGRMSIAVVDQDHTFAIFGACVTP